MAKHILLGLLLAGVLLTARAEIIVVVHADSPLRELSSQQVADLYLGRTRSINGSARLVLLDQPRDSELRGRFFRLLNGMDLRRVNAYWARLQFSGDTAPPVSLPDIQTTLDAVRQNPLAIGYIDASANLAVEGVRAVLSLK